MAKSDLVALDPGPEISGMAILRNGRIEKAANLANVTLVKVIASWGPKDSLLVLIEDVKPYGARLSQDLIDTCKWIGELQYRLEKAGIAFKLIPRNTVKSWIFRTFPEISIPIIEKIIICRNRRRQDGEYCKPHPSYVNDRIVEAAMRHAWQIKKPKPGHPNQYRLRKHSYQALALACSFLDLKNPEILINAKAVKHISDAQTAISDKIRASASAFGRQGGLIGGKARLTTLSAERRQEIARKAAEARWGKKSAQ